MDLPHYTSREEIANSITHGVGAVLSVAGLVILIALASIHGDAWHVVGVTVYGFSLVTLYSISTLYHSVRSPKAKRTLRILDHASIYLLIAGTYTPFTLVNLRGPWGWTMFGIVWAAAAAGAILKIFYTGRWRVASTLLYLALGWLAVVAVKPLMASVSITGLALLAAGGLAYTLGVLFYAWKVLPYHHAVWHGFVLAGSVCHYFAIVLSVVLS